MKPSREIRRTDMRGTVLSVGTCPADGKVRYKTRAGARRAARQRWPARRFTAYKCGDYWHLTTQGKDVTVFWRERRATSTSP